MSEQITNEERANLIKDSMDYRIWEALGYSDEYANYIMAKGDRPLCNGDMLTEAMEDGYLFDEFLIEKFA